MTAQKEQHQMTNSTKTNHTQAASNLGLCRSLLLASALLGLLPAVQATDWGFTLIGKPSAEPTEEREQPEIFEMTGAGTFDTEAATALDQPGGAGPAVADSQLNGPVVAGQAGLADHRRAVGR